MHEHIWHLQSRHSTSTGIVTYSRCACGVHTMTLRPLADHPQLTAIVRQ